MFGKALVAGQALALAAGAAPAFGNPFDPFCAAIQFQAPFFPVEGAAATSYCSSYFNIQTSTATASAVVTAAGTSTANVAATTTTTPTTTVYSTTSTCYTPTASAASKREPQFGVNPFGGPSNSIVSSACSCFGVNLHPATTTTTRRTTTSYVATVTSTTTTSTVTAAPVTVTGASTSYIPPSATHVAADGTSFLDYAGYDFYGNDLITGFCAAGGSVTLSNGTAVPCAGFTDCQNACDAQNHAGGQRCVGASYKISNTFCYLKYAVNDCAPIANSDVDSGLIH